ncbi:uncharacterized protein LOC131194853 [Ahaetulla prasina]|uniref:uncharacterized protein LOC131194853 n=1 Tax=Ahaetulla prasina TaxID=499056 RepID=UPI002649B534|nr:uncharacterized protein LOC131194853 [Ahaetulla prasina]
MEGQQAESVEIAQKFDSENLVEITYFPSEDMTQKPEVVEPACQLGAWPKDSDSWVSCRSGENISLGRNGEPPPSSQPHWRTVKPGKSGESLDWDLRNPLKSQSLLDLPETFERLEVRPRISSAHPPREPLAQPKFTFPPTREGEITEAQSRSDERRRTSLPSFRRQGVQAAPGTWGESQLPPPIDFSRQQRPTLPPAASIPPGWAFYPGQGWIQYQRQPASSAPFFPGGPRLIFASSAEAFQGLPSQQPGGIPPPFTTQQPATPQIPLQPQAGQLNPPAPPHPAPPPFKPTFDGNPHHLAYFLSRIEAYVEQYRHQYPSERSLINAISDGMNVGLASEWIAQLHNERAPELNDVHGFMALLRNRFQNDDLIAECETTLKTMKQGNKPLKQFVWDFRRVAGNLRHWPDRVLLHFFKEAIDQNIRKACSTRGIPEQLITGTTCP